MRKSNRQFNRIQDFEDVDNRLQKTPAYKFVHR